MPEEEYVEDVDGDEAEAYDIDTPATLRPDLEIWGIPEVDRGICIDSFEHRATLRKLKMSWRPIYNREGVLTNLIEVIAPEMSEAHSLSVIEERKGLLVDPTRANSDYETGWALILTDDVEKMVPPWVLNQTRTWLNLQEKKAANPKKIYRTRYTETPARCKFIKSDGVRCIFWSAGRADEGGLCRTHLLSKLNPELTSQALNTARKRVGQSAVAAVETLEEIMLHGLSEPMRVKAAESLLDRAGIRGGIEIEAKVETTERPAIELVMERLADLRKAAGEATNTIEAIEAAPAEIEDAIEEVAATELEPGAPEPQYTENPDTAVRRLTEKNERDR